MVLFRMCWERLLLLVILIYSVAATSSDCSCKYQGKTLSDSFVSDWPIHQPGKYQALPAITTYGTMCAAWDQQKDTPWYNYCDPLTADFAGAESWCQAPWCYVEPSCDSAVASSVFNGSDAAFYSYDACGNAPDCYNNPSATGCPYDPYGDNTYRIFKDNCRCKYHGATLPNDILTNYPSSEPGKYQAYNGIQFYGSTCAAWDQRPDTAWVNEFCPPGSDWCHQHFNWCQVPWCYVDESCPTKLPSSVFSGSTSIFYSYDTCLSAPDCYSQSVDPDNWGNLPSNCPFDGVTSTVTVANPQQYLPKWATSAYCDGRYTTASAPTPAPLACSSFQLSASCPPERCDYIATCQEKAYPVWHMVDVPYINCKSGRPPNPDLVKFQGNPGEWSVTLENFNPAVKDVLITFFRNAFKAVTVTYRLVDSSGAEILPTTSVTLQQAPPARRRRRIGGCRRRRICRRLDSLDEEEAVDDEYNGTEQFDAEEQDNVFVDESCEDFWLSDGREAVDMPETWGEAKQIFQDMCLSERFTAKSCSNATETIFVGPNDFDTPLKLDKRACNLLLQHLAAMETTEFEPNSTERTFEDVVASPTWELSPWRRLKGVSSGTASRSTSSLSNSYSGAARPTGYGYSGISRTSTSRIAMYGGVGFVAGAGTAYMFSRHYSRRRGGRGCDTRDANYRCVNTVSQDDQLLRDDLTDSTFISTDYSQPFKLYITKVDGPDFAASRICPPDDFCMECFDNPQACASCNSFTDPQDQDLFVTFSDATRDAKEWCYDPQQPSRSMVPWSQCRSGASCCDDTKSPQTCAAKDWCEDEGGEGAVVALVIIGVLFGCCICGGCLFVVWKNKQQQQCEEYGEDSFQQQHQPMVYGGQQPIFVQSPGGVPGEVMQQPGSNMMQVAVPEGIQPGQAITVQAPNGQILQVNVPPGVQPGQMMQVSY